jgi:hypothetical protein
VVSSEDATNARYSYQRHGTPTLDVVIAGLDPAIHRIESSMFLMDARVKPAHDESKSVPLV